MATCARCGAEILWKRLNGLPFAVDRHESARGAGRYVEYGNVLLPTTATADVLAFVDHRQSCGKPAFGNRARRRSGA